MRWPTGVKRPERWGSGRAAELKPTTIIAANVVIGCRLG